jgi:Tol biopolymer transport system component
MPRLNRRRAVLAAPALVAAALTIVVAAAPAKPPAKDGQIAFRRFFDVERTTGAIFLINPDGIGDRQITQPPQGGLDDQPNWKPDGSRILFTRQLSPDNPDGGSFWTIKPDGSDPELLSPGCAGGPPTCLVNEQKNTPVYSPDGRTIAYGWAAGEVRDDIGQIEFSEVYVMNADGSNSHPLTSFTKDAPYSQDVGPGAWSPDGRRLVIERSMSPVGDPAGARALFVINADGSGTRQLTPWALRAGGRADWSTDGRRILFRTIPADDAPGGDIYTIRPDGTGLRQLTHFPPTGNLHELGFSPDAKSIVFSKGGATGDLFVMRANGTGIRQITQTELSENWPDWGPGRGH